MGLQIFSIDIETTGLSPDNSDLLEIGLAYYDFEKMKGKTYQEMLSEVPKRKIITKLKKYNQLQGNIVAFEMHLTSGLLQNYKNLDKVEDIELEEDVVVAHSSFDVIIQIYKFMLDVGYITDKELKEKGLEFLTANYYNLDDVVSIVKDYNFRKTITVAGKNVASFDIPYLQNLLLEWNKYMRVRHRVFDPTVFFYDKSLDRLPDLKQCMDIAKNTDESFPSGEVAHDSLSDCLDVLKLIHYVNNRYDISKTLIN